MRQGSEFDIWRLSEESVDERHQPLPPCLGGPPERLHVKSARTEEWDGRAKIHEGGVLRVSAVRPGPVRSQFRAAVQLIGLAAVGLFFALSCGCGKNPSLTSTNQPPQNQSRVQPQVKTLA